MASFRFKLAGLPIGPLGRIYQLPDAAALRVLDGLRKEGETDMQVLTRVFDAVMEDMLSKAHAYRKRTLQDAAVAGVTKDTSTGSDDNV